jgi:hypothetical protein
MTISRTVILTASVFALAGACMAYDRSNVTLPLSASAPRTMLACQMPHKRTFAANPTTPTTTNETMVIELKGDQWNLVSYNGEDVAAEVGKTVSVPLRVTPDFYVLSEKFEKHSGDGDRFVTSGSALTINRSTGEYRASIHWADAKASVPEWIDDDYTGQCAPTSPKL